MPWLLDTNILSEIRRLEPEPKVLAFIAARPLDELYISTVTLAELRFGIERLDAGERRDELNRWLMHTMRRMFHQRILLVTEDILFQWRVLMEEGRKIGHTYSQPDLIIAATALHHGFTVVTRDRDDFHKAGATVINPWEEPPQERPRASTNAVGLAPAHLGFPNTNRATIQIEGLFDCLITITGISNLDFQPSKHEIINLKSRFWLLFTRSSPLIVL